MVDPKVLNRALLHGAATAIALAITLAVAKSLLWHRIANSDATSQDVLIELGRAVVIAGVLLYLHVRLMPQRFRDATVLGLFLAVIVLLNDVWALITRHLATRNALFAGVVAMSTIGGSLLIYILNSRRNAVSRRSG